MRPNCKEASISSRFLFWVVLNTLSDLGSAIGLALVASSLKMNQSLCWCTVPDYFVRLASGEHGNVGVERFREKFWNADLQITLTPVQVPSSSREF